MQKSLRPITRMPSQKLWSYLQIANDVLLYTLIGLFNFIKLLFRLVWLLVNLQCSLTIKFFNRILPKTDNSKSKDTQKTGQEKHQGERKSILQKIKQFKLSSVEQIMVTKINSLEQSIPKCLSKWFPQCLKFDNSKLKVMTLEEMKKSSNQVLVDIKKVNAKDNKMDLKIDTKKSLIKQSRIYYVPTYLRVKVKNFTAIDLDKLQAEVNADVIISFVYGNDDLIKIPKQVAVRLLNEVVLNFQRDDSLKLDETDNVHISTKEEKEKYHIQFTVRKKLHMRIESRVYYTPFEQLSLILPITIQQLTPKTVVTKQLNQTAGKQEQVCYEASIKFNYMDNDGHFIKIDFTEEKHFGYYSLIETGLVAKYSNKRITSIEELEKYNEKLKKDKVRDEGKNQKGMGNGSPQRGLKNIITKIQQSSEQNDPLINRKQHLIVDKEQQFKKNKNKQLLSQKEETKPNVKPSFQQLCNKHTQNRSKESKQKEKQQLKYFQYSFFKIPIYKHPMASLVMIFLPLWSLAIINLGIFFQQNSLSQRIASIASLMIAFIALNETIRSQIPPHPRVVFVELLVYAEMIACFLCLVNSYEVSQVQNYRMEWTECKMFIIALVIFVIEIFIIFVIGLYHYYVMVPSYELQEAKPKFDKINTKNWRNQECDQHFQNLIQKTIDATPTHKGLTESKKLKDINEQLTKRYQKPCQGVQKDELVKQVLRSLNTSIRNTSHFTKQPLLSVNKVPQEEQNEKQKFLFQKTFSRLEK